MTDITVVHRYLTVGFPGWERLMAGRRAHCVPIDAISSIQVSGWTSEFLGFRSGLAVPGVRKLGTFRHPNGTRRLVSMTRGEPLLRIRFHSKALGAGFDELLISSHDAAGIASELDRLLTLKKN